MRLAHYAPSPRAQIADKRAIEADEPKMTGFVFKIQANMDPNHRDRIAFMRVCSGKLSRGMKAKLVRTGKPMPLNAPQFFFARDRSIAEEAFAGDIVGLPNHGTLRIGDTLTEGEDIVFKGVPSFAPEILRRVKLKDAMKAKKLREALQQMAEEGVVQLFLPHDGAPCHRRRRRRAPARRAEGAHGRRIFAARRFRALPVLDRALGLERRQARSAEIRRAQAVLDGRRPRRRPGVHGVEPVHAEIRRRTRARGHLLGREGLSEGRRRPEPEAHARAQVRDDGRPQPARLPDTTANASTNRSKSASVR
jgi:hypothetical protein